MGKNGNFIELNGKRYDPISGKMLHAEAKPAPKASGRVLDGFIAPAGYASAHHITPVVARAQPVALKPIAKKPTMDITRPAGHKIAHHAPKKSQTLMRSAVARPEGSLKSKVKPVSHSDSVLQQPKFEVVKKLAHPRVDPKRASRSSAVSQSALVNRFAVPASKPVPKPTQIPAATFAAIKPVHAAAPAQHSVAKPAASSLDIFERALQTANSHMELPPAHGKKLKTKRRKPLLGKRALSIGGATLAVMLFAVVFVAQNQSNLTLKYASSRAGFSASLPSYKPEGFAVGKFTYSPGKVGVQYKSTVSDQSFSLMQRSSTLDSESLKNEYVASRGDFKTMHSAGRTIYIYGSNNATWVNGGVWYDIDSTGNLSTKELVSLAASM